MTLFEESCFIHGVRVNRLGESDRNSMEEVEIDRRVPLKLSTDDWVVAPLDFDKVSDALAPIFSGDF